MSQEIIEMLETELDQERALNDKLLHLVLSMMDRLWPENEKKAMQSLTSQVEATVGKKESVNGRHA
jgi:flagellin-specific chaperone FliS